MSQQFIADKIADFTENDENADGGIFCDFEGDENTRQIYTIWNILKATNQGVET